VSYGGYGVTVTVRVTVTVHSIAVHQCPSLSPLCRTDPVQGEEKALSASVSRLIHLPSTHETLPRQRSAP